VVEIGFALYERLMGNVVQGWTTIMLAVALGSSAQLLMIGVLGEYVGRIYEEIKRRPLYVTAEQINCDESARAVNGSAASSSND
jgi:dolichol-phosphate mannosyltransferase